LGDVVAGRDSIRNGPGAADVDGEQRNDDMERAAEVLRALSHPARLRIIDALSTGEVCVKGLEEILGIPQPSVSQHLTRLKYAGLIESERRGHLVCYRLAHDRAAKILRALMEEGEAGAK